MNRLSASRFCVVSGKYLTVAGLVLLAIRSFAIEIFSFPPENNYIAPAGGDGTGRGNVFFCGGKRYRCQKRAD